VGLLDPPFTGKRLVAIVSGGDEASWALTASSFISLLFALPTRFAEAFVRLNLKTVFIGTVVVVTVLVWVTRSEVALITAFFLLSGCVLASTVPALLIDHLDRISLGWDGAGIVGTDSGEVGLWRAYAAPAVRGSHTIEFATPEGEASGIAHTSMTESSDTIESVVEYTRRIFGHPEH
jgi:hypothetical protein